jgi:hypothetical protein
MLNEAKNFVKTMYRELNYNDLIVYTQTHLSEVEKRN